MGPIASDTPNVDDHPYRAGDRDDFDRLYRETYTRVRFTLQGLLRDAAAAEDCAQEAFVRAFRAWPSWKGDAPAEAWIHRIAINAAFSYRRRERLRSLTESIRRIHPSDPAADSAARLELLDALRRLPPREAAAIVLRHSHGYSNREIAVALGVPESTVSSRLAAGKRRLVRLLGEAEVMRLQEDHR
jgi:RNA polymerase sigma-70 factor (ECF subfamily)